MQDLARENFFREIAKFAFIALVIVIPIRLFVAQPFIVNGSSMEPTFETGQYLIVDQLSYRIAEPQRGEVVIFNYPKDPTKFFIKRVIGLPGETVVLHDGEVTIKNETVPDGFTLNEPYLDPAHIGPSAYDNQTVALGADEYFVMGDNRIASSDSRVWGPLQNSFIVGRAFVRLLPISMINFLPGDHREE